MMRQFLLGIAAFFAEDGLPDAQPSNPPPERLVVGHAVISRRDPTLRIIVPRHAHYVGGDHWIMYDAIDCEVHVFVEAAQKRRLKRFYWVQFEHYLPNAVDARYDYSDPRNLRLRLWGMPFRARPRFGPTSEIPAPGSDAARVRGLIERAGYTFPPDMMNVRLVHLLDDPTDTGKGRKEMLLFYVQDLASAGVTSDQLSDGSKVSPQWAPIQRQLITNAAARFSVVREHPPRP